MIEFENRNQNPNMEKKLQIKNAQSSKAIWDMIKLLYSPFHKTLPKSSLKMNWISVRFYEMGDSCMNQIIKNKNMTF